MNLKTYRARSMADVLAEVKRDLGPKAVILHTRSYRVGSWFGIGGKPVIEVTASDGDGVTAPARRPAVPRPARVELSPAVPTPARAETSPAPVATAGTRTEPVARQEVRDVVVMPVRQRTAPGDDRAGPRPVEEELASIKRMMGHVIQASRRTTLLVARGGTSAAGAACEGGGGGSESLSDPLFAQYLRMLESEVASEIADEVVGRVRDELSPAELADPGIVRETVVRRLAGMVPVDGAAPAPPKAADGRPMTIALVGPTGVGKTTTLAKLAASYKLRHGRKVGLVTSDTYRIAAVDQLRTYADIIGLPLKVVLTASEMAAACESFRGFDAVLIDTAGRSPNDGGRLAELQTFLDAAKPHQTHLVLSSTVSEAALISAAERFARVRPDRVIFTKLDEAVNFGVLFSVARRIDLKLSYVTTGQEVPDHIEIGRPDRLARLVLDGPRAVPQEVAS